MRIYRPLRQTADRPSAALLWLHGGGFVFGDIDSYDPLCRALANRAGMNVLSFEYRLAPEYPFPAASEDVDDAWQWLHAHAGDLNMAPDRLAIGGDSAGGTLAIGTALSALPDARPRALALAYPGTASDLSSASHQSFADGFLLTRRTIAWCYDHYRGPLQSMQHDPRLAPLTARRLAHLPPTVMLLAGCDPLHDEGLAFEQRLDEANVPVTLLDHPTMIHGFLSYPGAIPLAATALSAFGKALARIVDDDRRR
jgi:acetyl esterase